MQVAAVWTGDEQASFKKVLAEFEKRTGAKTEYVPTGDSAATFLGQRVEGNAPPDVAFLRSPAHSSSSRRRAGSSCPRRTCRQRPAELLDAVADAGDERQQAVRRLLQGRQQVAGLVQRQGRQELAGDRAQDVGRPAQKTALPPTPARLRSPPAARRLVLTDWFENVYLSQAGPDMYAQAGQAPDPVDRPAGDAGAADPRAGVGQERLVPGRNRRALQTEFPASSAAGVRRHPEGRHAAGRGLRRHEHHQGHQGEDRAGRQFFGFPAVGTGKPPVVTGGDVAVAMKDSPGAMALLKFLATTDAAQIWAQQGGYMSPNKNLDLRRTTTTPPGRSRRTDRRRATASRVRHVRPGAVRVRRHQGRRRSGATSRTSCANPSDVQGAQAKLEADAAKAFGSGRATGRHGRSDDLRPPGAISSPPSPPPGPHAGRAARPRRRGAARAVVPAARGRMLGVLDRLSDRVDVRAQPSSARTAGSDFAGLGNYKVTLFTDDEHVAPRSRTT
ncbi:carbohydrate ABC transporter substrate-binding protein [Yinghuangia aomiensis]